MKNQLVKKPDIYLLAVLLLCAGLSFLVYFLLFRAPGSTVTVTVDGIPYASYPLSTDLRVEIKGTNGTDVLQLQGGIVQMLQADCPDRICVSHKPISHAGESIICLPNRIVVEIKGTADSPVVDSVSQ